MKIDTREDRHGIHILELTGEMDLYSSNTLKETVVQLWNDGVTRLVIDLSQLEYVDSSGIGVLLAVYSSSQKRGNRITFAGATGSVMKVIELTKLDGFLPMEPSTERSIEALAPSETSQQADHSKIRQLIVDPHSPLLDTRNMYHKRFYLDLSQVRRLANLIAQKAPNHLRDINILEQQISELLKNAVKHGNGNDSSKAVAVWFQFTDESARLIVEDEGPGFQKIEEWNEFYRNKIEAYHAKDFEKMMNYLAFRTEQSGQEDGGNAMMAAVEYWNEGVVFNEARNRVAVMRSFEEEAGA